MVDPPADFADVLLAEGPFHPLEHTVLSQRVAQILGVITIGRFQEDVEVVRHAGPGHGFQSAELQDLVHEEPELLPFYVSENEFSSSDAAEDVIVGHRLRISGQDARFHLCFSFW